MTKEEFDQRYRKIVDKVHDVVTDQKYIDKLFADYQVTEDDDPSRVEFLLANSYANVLAYNLLKEFLVDNSRQEE